MARMDDMPAELLRMITRGLPYKDKLAVSQMNRCLRNFGVPWDLQTVKLHKFPTTLNVSATISEPSVARKFLSFYSEDEDVKAWKGKTTTDSVTNNLKFPFPLADRPIFNSFFYIFFLLQFAT
ncbi:hypothetical protein PENTCL1PPCAC_4128, partial [Pristionchus entomophagus]